jgi:hypothetical protein
MNAFALARVPFTLRLGRKGALADVNAFTLPCTAVLKWVSI